MSTPPAIRSIPAAYERASRRSTRRSAPAARSTGSPRARSPSSPATPRWARCRGAPLPPVRPRVRPTSAPRCCWTSDGLLTPTATVVRRLPGPAGAGLLEPDRAQRALEAAGRSVRAGRPDRADAPARPGPGGRAGRRSPPAPGALRARPRARRRPSTLLCGTGARPRHRLLRAAPAPAPAGTRWSPPAPAGRLDRARDGADRGRRAVPGARLHAAGRARPAPAWASSPRPTRTACWSRSSTRGRRRSRGRCCARGGAEVGELRVGRALRAARRAGRWRSRRSTARWRRRAPRSTSTPASACSPGAVMKTGGAARGKRRPELLSRSRSGGTARRGDVDRLGALGPLARLVLDLRTLRQRAEARSAAMLEKWTKRSLPPSSGSMKPNPLASLNHFTVPVATLAPPDHERWRCTYPRTTLTFSP